MTRISGRPCDSSEDDKGGAACGNRTILLGGVEIGARRSYPGATKEGWRNEEGEAVTERLPTAFPGASSCAGVCRDCARCTRTVWASLRRRGRVEPALCFWALGSGLWDAWALIQPRGWLMAGAADLDQRLCGCLIIRKGPSYCAGDVSRSEGFLLAAWANRAYGDDTAGINDKPGATLGALGADAKSCWCVVGRVGGCACVVL